MPLFCLCFYGLISGSRIKTLGQHLAMYVRDLELNFCGVNTIDPVFNISFGLRDVLSERMK